MSARWTMADYESYLKRSGKKGSTTGTTLKSVKQKDAKPAVKLPKEPSEIEAEFDTLWMVLCKDLPSPVCEHQLWMPERRHKLDRAWPDLKIVVEIEGFGHGLSGRYERDLYKYNRLAAEDWVLLRCNRKTLFEEPGAFFDLLRKAIEEKLAQCCEGKREE